MLEEASAGAARINPAEAIPQAPATRNVGRLPVRGVDMVTSWSGPN
jgi:hypothetical protein